MKKNVLLPVRGYLLLTGLFLTQLAFGQFHISGHCIRPLGDSIADVNVMKFQWDTIAQRTDSLGQFRFENLAARQSVTIKPVKDGNDRNGLSTLDILLTGRHILSLEPFTSPMQILAADVNDTRVVTTADMVVMRRLLLLVDTAYTATNAWRFVRTNYVFQDSMNPFFEPLTNHFYADSITENLNSIDFYGVKMGDVNQSAVMPRLNALDDRAAFGESRVPTYIYVTSDENTIQMPLPSHSAGMQLSFFVPTTAGQLRNVFIEGIDSDMYEAVQEGNEIRFSFVNPMGVKVDKVDFHFSGPAKSTELTLSSSIEPELYLYDQDQIITQFIQFDYKRPTPLSIVQQPVREKLILKGDVEAYAKWEIYNQQGVRLLTQVNQNPSNLQVNSLNAGWYVLVATDATGKQTALPFIKI